MKIGVITFWQSKDNYGQHLQSFAMQTYLKKLGHEPFLIRFKEGTAPQASFKIKNIFKYLKKIPTYINFYIKLCQDKQDSEIWEQSGGFLERNLHGFIADNINLSPILTEDELISNPPQADAYICGSDQVWGGSELYYLSFASDNSKKIAYAPSLGGLTHFEPDYERMMKRMLSRFDFIGMREQSGVDVCHRLGFPNATKVVDPTLLLTTGDYDKIKVNIKKEKPYAFIYLLGNPTSCSIEHIMAYLNDRGLHYIYVASQKRIDNYEKTFATMGEWIGYLSNADLVITNSFHCTVFSLIYHRPFLTLKLNNGYERMNTRVIELLSESKLLSQLIDDNICNSSTDNIDFSSFDEYRLLEERKSSNYLMSVLH